LERAPFGFFSEHRVAELVTDVAIAGGGIAGSALACALADALGPGACIAIVERGDAPAAGATRAFALSAASVHLLDVLGLWSPIASEAQPVTRVEVTDSRLDDTFRPVLVSYDNTVAGGEAATYVVAEESLIRTLRAGIRRRPQITSLDGHGVAGLFPGPHTIALGALVPSAGAAVRAKLLVAADGRDSPVREAAGITAVRWRYPQLGIVAVVHHTRPHAGRAVQHFLPSGPFAILPLTEQRSCITWTEAEDKARAILELGEDGFRDAVMRRFDYRLGDVTHVGARGAWPLEMHLARALVAPRLALIGDAAHGVHPIAGQGLNLGLRDVAALAEVLADAARLGLDIGMHTVLARYERWRRLDSALSAATFDALNRLFSNDSTLLRSARGVGLGLVERMPLLKQFFVAEAAGLSGSVPRMLRGEPP
jgi:2-octaprenyl-6-methoxyphenol hydroxylase